jgi:hypothetical protein
MGIDKSYYAQKTQEYDIQESKKYFSHVCVSDLREKLLQFLDGHSSLQEKEVKRLKQVQTLLKIGQKKKILSPYLHAKAVSAQQLYDNLICKIQKVTVLEIISQNVVILNEIDHIIEEFNYTIVALQSVCDELVKIQN